MSDLFLAGTGREDITPEIGAWLMGYNPLRRAETLNDRLNFTAYAFERGGVRAIVAASDLCLIREPLMSELRHAMEQGQHQQSCRSRIHI